MLRVAALQLKASTQRQDVHRRVAGLVEEAAKRGAKLAVLPESFTGIYGADHFEANGEVWKNKDSGTKLISNLAKEHGIVVVGGVIEMHPINKKLYSTIAAFDPRGLEVARYRKMHLSTVPGTLGNKMTEASTLTPGEELAWFDIADGGTPDSDGRGWRVGIACGFDLRFPEVAGLYSNTPPMGLGSELLLYPSASTNIAGWDSLLKARALDSQCFVMGVHAAHDDNEGNNSMMIGPAGETLSESSDCTSDCCIVADLSLRSLIDVRQKAPLKEARRSHVYGDALRNVHSNPMAMMRKGPNV